MIRKSLPSGCDPTGGYRFSLATNAERVCAEVMLKQKGSKTKMRRLLFLNGIKAFEAAARSGSFAAAGLELNVSPAAISRMVHLLEQRLGVVLFERKADRLVMT